MSTAEQAQLDALDALRGNTGHHSDLAKQVEALGFCVVADSDDNELSTIRLEGVWGKNGEDIIVGTIRGDAEAVISLGANAARVAMREAIRPDSE